MNKIILNKLELKTFTEQDALDYCLLNNINPDNIKILDLRNNKLTDISDIKLFKNVTILRLNQNEIKDISVIKYLTELKSLNIERLKLESDQIQYISKNLISLYCEN